MVGDYVMVLKGGALPFVLRAGNELSIAFADRKLEADDSRTYKSRITDLEFDFSKERGLPPDLLKYMGLKLEQVGGDVDAAAKSINMTRSLKLENYLGNEVSRGDKVDLPQFSVVGASYVHGISEGEALLQVDPLYCRDYLYTLGNGWESIFLQ
jgi:hypothetical protein